jgi:hypothetical protein
MDRPSSPESPLSAPEGGDDVPATVRMPLPDVSSDADWVPAPSSWSDAARRRQVARADANEALRQLARMVEPVLRPETGAARPAVQPAPVDIDLPLTVTDATTGWDRLSEVSDPAEPAVNDAFQPLDMSILGRDRLNPAGVRFLDELPDEFRPVQTATRHPHIVNKMAVLRGNAQALRDYFDELLLTTRSARRGFSLEVMAELFSLQRRLAEPWDDDGASDRTLRG